jgi:elongation factor Ts
MNLSKIKTLRELTGLGMLEVKKALEEANDDMEEATRILMTKTIKKEQTRRVASIGLTSVETHGNEAILFEINAETDFVAKHPDFINMMLDLGNVLMHSKVFSVKQALNAPYQSYTVQDEINRIGNLVKENVYLRRFHRILKQDNQSFATYKHLGGKLSVLVIYQGDEKIGKELALHITSHGPKYLSFDDLDKETYNFEEMMLLKENPSFTKLEIEEKIKAMCLYDQPFIKNPDQRVKEILNQSKVVDFYRFELGQGIENKLNCRLDIPCDGSKITVTPSL